MGRVGSKGMEEGEGKRWKERMGRKKGFSVI